MSRNKTAVPEAREALNKFKMEVANELGATNPNPFENGSLASMHTGYITRRLVEIGERELMKTQNKK